MYTTITHVHNKRPTLLQKKLTFDAKGLTLLQKKLTLVNKRVKLFREKYITEAFGLSGSPVRGLETAETAEEFRIKCGEVRKSSGSSAEKCSRVRDRCGEVLKSSGSVRRSAQKFGIKCGGHSADVSSVCWSSEIQDGSLDVHPRPVGLCRHHLLLLHHRICWIVLLASSCCLLEDRRVGIGELCIFHLVFCPCGLWHIDGPSWLRFRDTWDDCLCL